GSLAGRQATSSNIAASWPGATEDKANSDSAASQQRALWLPPRLTADAQIAPSVTGDCSISSSLKKRYQGTTASKKQCGPYNVALLGKGGMREIDGEGAHGGRAVKKSRVAAVVTVRDGFDDAWRKLPIWASGKVSSDYATSIYLSTRLLAESLPVTARLRTPRAV
ncbi:hypothetical protein KUCAC02_028897, partial [Chaenocephalus aceratus]